MKIILTIFLFLAAVGVFAALSPYVHREAVERELARLARLALAEEGFQGVKVSVDHSTITLTMLGGTGDDAVRVAGLLRAQVAGARFPEEGGVQLLTLPSEFPTVRISRETGDGPVILEGVIAEDDRSLVQFLEDRFLETGKAEAVDNRIKFAEDRLPFERGAELATMGAELGRLARPFTLELSKGKLSLTAEVPDAGTKAALLRIAESAGADAIDDQLAVAETVIPDQPATLRIIRTKNGYTLEGQLTDEKIAHQLVFSVQRKDPSLRFADGIQLSERVLSPIWFDEAKELMSHFLEGVEEGATAELSHQRVQVAATVLDEETLASIEALIARIEEKHGESEADSPGDQPFESIARLRLAVDPVPGSSASPGQGPRIHARFARGILTLSGEVPAAAEAERIVDAVQEALAGLEVENELQDSEQIIEEEWLHRLPSFLVGLCQRTTSAEATLGRGRVELAGESSGAADPQILRNLAVNTVPSGYTVENRIAYVPESVALTEDQRQTLSGLFAEQPIYFASGSGSVNPEGEGKLERIHEAIAETGADAGLVVGGFSDNRGNPETNRALSIQRAEAVRDALVELGIPKERIEAVSFGIDEINTSSSQRWKARRVEVRLRESAEVQNED